MENNLDPLNMGRLEVSVPAIYGEAKNWAMPCVPYAGKGVGLFLVPPKGANVWVEFEGGDTDYPIVAGCFWATGETPVTPAIEKTKALFTDAIKLTLSDLKGVSLEVSPPAAAGKLEVKLDQSGIELKNGAASVKLTPASVSVNNGALEVI